MHSYNPVDSIQSYLKNQTLIPENGFSLEGSHIAVSNPATKKIIGFVHGFTAEDTQEKIQLCEKSLSGWQSMGAYKRAEILNRWASLITENREDLATIITLEQGKPIAEARGEVDYAASFVSWFAEEGKRHYGDVIPSHIDGTRMITLKQAIGVCAAVTPWNFPCAMITRKASAALAAGCGMIVRPADETPFSAIALQTLADLAGIPKGTLVTITGDAETIVDTLTDSEVVRALSFTGSTKIGKLITQKSAKTLKKVSMELGGHAPFMVLADANLDAAVDGVIDAKFATSGQDCLAVNKCFVHHSLYSGFVKRVTERVEALVIGNGLDDGIDIGPLISQAAVEKCKKQVSDALDKGAVLNCGGQTAVNGDQYFNPTVISNATGDMLIRTEETFGPILAISSFADLPQMIAEANSTPYGLAAYIYGNSMPTLWGLSEKLEYGMIAINTPSMTGPPVPFGGVKQSGLGREGSKYGLDEYTEIKYICLGGM